MVLSGDWKVSLTSCKGLTGEPDAVELHFEGREWHFSIQDAADGDSSKEVPLKVNKTLYLYGSHAEGSVAVVLKKGDQVIGRATVPHDKAEASEEWLTLMKSADGSVAGHILFKSSWVSKIYKTPTGRNNLLVASYILLLLVWGLSNVFLIPVNINLLLTTVTIVYVGCHRSLRLRDRRAVSEDEQETISSDDALMFPVIGSAVLFGLYLLVTYVNKDYVSILLSVYIGVIGTYVLTSTLAPYLEPFVPYKEAYGFTTNVPFMGRLDLRFTVPELISFAPAVVLTGLYLKTKHRALNNLFGIAFSIQGIERISLGSYKVGAILLCGLFFYDIFWVFGTKVMVTVAKSFDAPIKLIFPRGFEKANDYSILGLGDIVIPGIFIALLLRYDAERNAISPLSGPFARFSKPFFHFAILAYALGLGITIFVMNYFHAAQPALLYLVPACLLSSLATALVLGDLKGLFAYNEEEEPPKDSTDGAKQEGTGEKSTEITTDASTAQHKKQK